MLRGEMERREMKKEDGGGKGKMDERHQKGNKREDKME